MRSQAIILALALAFALPASAQFVGPSASGQQMSVAAAAEARIGSYVTLSGTILSHLREDYFMFSDGTNQIRVEIEPGVFNGRQIGPTTRVQIVGEVDRAGNGTRYVWVKSLQLL